MENHQKNIKKIFLQFCFLIAILILITENFLKKDIVNDPTEIVTALFVTTAISSSYLFTRLHLESIKELKQQNITEIWITGPLIITGTYIAATTFGYQFVENELIKNLLQQTIPYQKPIIISYAAWTIFSTSSIASTKNNFKPSMKGKTKMNKENTKDKKIYNCTLKSKATSNIFHTQIIAKDDLECVSKAEERYNRLSWGTIAALVGDQNIELDYTVPDHPEVYKRPDFSEIELKYICLGNPDQENFIEENKWPEEIEAEADNPYAKLVQTV